MTFRNFHNALRILFNLDADDLIGSGVLTDKQWPEFRDNPHRWFIQADDQTAYQLWLLIVSRMKP